MPTWVQLILMGVSLFLDRVTGSVRRGFVSSQQFVRQVGGVCLCSTPSLFQVLCAFVGGGDSILLMSLVTKSGL